MSDTSQGDGWWQASDGKWYPPEQAAGAAPPPPPGGGVQYAEPEKKKRRTWLWVLIAVVVLLGGCVALLASAADEVADELERAEAEAIEQVSCEVTGVDVLGDVSVDLTADNTTSKRSDFYVEFELRDAEGTFLGDGFGSLTNVPAGEKATDTGLSTVDAPDGSADGVTCEVIDVTRTASS